VSASVDPRLGWWVSRASGMVAWVVVAAAVVWGLLASTKLIRKRGIPAWILDLHRYLGTLTVVFVIVHVGAIWLDSFVSFSPQQLFVPFVSSWRPHAVAWGIFATYLLLAIQLTSWAMRRLPRRLWHRVHVLSVPMLVLATVHGFLAGTDRSSRATQWTAFVILACIVLLLSIRVLTPGRAPRPVRSAGTPQPRAGRPVGVRDESVA
jgi:predicted ferric reductase